MKNFLKKFRFAIIFSETFGMREDMRTRKFPAGNISCSEKVIAKKKILKNLRYQTAGFTLLIAMVTTSMLLLVSFVIIDIATKQLVLASAAESSQYAFYNADSGTECALYWDLKNPNNPGTSAFATSTPGTISCNDQTVSTGSQTVPTVPGVPSVIGGSSTSIFSINLNQGCVIVEVSKAAGGGTTITSKGYNTCDTSSPRRFERGVTLSY